MESSAEGLRWALRQYEAQPASAVEVEPEELVEAGEAVHVAVRDDDIGDAPELALGERRATRGQKGRTGTRPDRSGRPH